MPASTVSNHSQNVFETFSPTNLNFIALLHPEIQTSHNDES